MDFKDIVYTVFPLAGTGFLLGCIPMLMGLGVRLAFYIFRQAQ